MTALGIDISDRAVKYAAFSSHHYPKLEIFGEERIPPGVVEGGVIKQEDVVEISNGSSREGEIHLSSFSDIKKSKEILNEVVSQTVVLSKKIVEVKPGQRIKTRAFIVQVFDPRYFEVCSKCGKRVLENECKEHGKVDSNKRALLNIVLDDGSETIRAVLFGEQINLLGFDNEEMEGIVVRLLKDKNVRLAVAEYCTGGLISKRITDVSGSSACFDRGIVSYSNEAKMQLLKVPSKLIEEYGAVSSQAAMAMADGARRISNTEIGIGVTGIAGPTGGTSEKPVGLVYIALSEKGKETRCKGYNFTGSRQMIRMKSSQMALDMLRRTLINIQ